jgi:aerobic carbon-monoxide dehydrogenase small subunit
VRAVRDAAAAIRTSGASAEPATPTVDAGEAGTPEAGIPAKPVPDEAIPQPVP